MTYIKELDIIRFFAFLIVFTSHYFYFFRPKDELTYFFTQGDVGVQIFFVLSGFLITTILINEKNQTEKIDFKKFYVRRILRIWPLYFLVVFLGTVLAIIFGKFDHVHLLSLLTFTSNFSLINDDNFYLPLIILWSIAMEEQYYLIWPALVFYLKKKQLQIFLFTALILSIWFKYFGTDVWQVAAYHPFSNILYLALGGLIALNSKSLLVTTLTKTSEKLMTFSKISSSKTLLYLGKISYGLYMYHIFALLIFGNYFISLIFAIVISHFSYKYFEQPIIKAYKARFPTSVEVKS